MAENRLAFACDLARMFGDSEHGSHDRLMGYSQAVSGSNWFVPSQEDLAAVL